MIFIVHLKQEGLYSAFFATVLYLFVIDGLMYVKQLIWPFLFPNAQDFNTHLFEVGYSSKIFPKSKECIICLEDHQTGEPVVPLQCRHCFHKAHLMEWLNLKRECPICSKPIIAYDYLKFKAKFKWTRACLTVNSYISK